MTYHPGNALIIDEKLHLLKGNKPDGTDGVQYDTLKFIEDYFEEEGIPIYYMDSDFDDPQKIKEKINKFQNVRFLILDLALTGDDPDDTDKELIKLIIGNSIKKFGYFFLFINSAHLEFWNGTVKPELPEYEHHLNFMTIELDKNNLEGLRQKVQQAPETKFSLNIIYKFESQLNKSRDSAFATFFDFNKQTWEEILRILNDESGSFSGFDLTNIFLSILKQHLTNIKYPTFNLQQQNAPQDTTLIKKIFQSLYYLKFDEIPTEWTGNVYSTTIGSANEQKYAVIINPECDLAQKKYLKYKVVYGFELNEDTLPQVYDNNGSINLTPVMVKRAGKNSKGKWKAFDVLSKGEGLPEHIFVLRFASENEKSIILDCRDSTTMDFIPAYWKFLFRISDSMVTEILDKYSALYNRKGLIGFPLEGIKLRD